MPPVAALRATATEGIGQFNRPRGAIDTMNSDKGKAGQHRANYSRDNVNGGWLIRVVGPFANRFRGREVPVLTNSGENHPEKLDKLIWSGVDEGNVNPADKGKNVALYSFLPKPKDELDDAILF